jgi:hypothetical protein
MELFFKRTTWLNLILSGGLIIAITSCQKQQMQDGDEPPLLLEDPPAESSGPAGPMADNSRCHVCHDDFRKEELAVVHARAEIGCEDCHGSSDAHCSDEDNITPPDIMYPRASLNLFCMNCHSKLAGEHHGPILKGTATEKKYCTDCHGKHRREHRTRRWDKATGKLIEDDRVRMINDEMLKKE